jgi:hypothetical protein
MNKMIKFSLFLNIAVLIPVCFVIISGQSFVSNSWGSEQPSLYILVSIYLTILFASIYLLIKPNLYLIFSLLMMQVIYKLLTPVFVGTLENPVVLLNIVISAVHMISLRLIIKSPNFSLNDSN